MIKNDNDKLDDLEDNNILEFIFHLPGRVILWMRYMNPDNNIKSIFQTSRHAKSGIMVKAISIGFWFFLLVFIMTFLIDNIKPY